MAVQASGVATLMDVLSELDPGGRQLDIAEVLTQQNEVLADMHWEEGNKVTGHVGAARTVLPTPSFRALNAGVPVTKSGSTTIEETTALLEDFSQVDRELAAMSGNVDQYRLKQARPHVQGMSNKMATELFYGNAGTNPLGFTGFAARYNTLSTTTNKAAANVINAGGTGSALRSIYLVGWGSTTRTRPTPRAPALTACRPRLSCSTPAATSSWVTVTTGFGASACSCRIGASSSASRTSIPLR
jgi:hypothetical protein